jgi:hypothetical protein
LRNAGSLQFNARPAVRTWPEQTRRYEKSSSSGNFGQEQPNLQPDRRKGQPSLLVQLVSQNNTSRCDPVWDGPRQLNARWELAHGLQRPPSAGALKVVAVDTKQDTAQILTALREGNRSFFVGAQSCAFAQPPLAAAHLQHHDAASV